MSNKKYIKCEPVLSSLKRISTKELKEVNLKGFALVSKDNSNGIYCETFLTYEGDYNEMPIIQICKREKLIGKEWTISNGYTGAHCDALLAFGGIK